MNNEQALRVMLSEILTHILISEMDNFKLFAKKDNQYLHIVIGTDLAERDLKELREKTIAILKTIVVLKVYPKEL